MSAVTIPLPEIVKRLAAKVACNEETSGAFLKEFSVVVAQGLATDGSVKIEGLGTFRVTTDMEGKPTVDFAPDALLAETVNEPFAMFESVELADSLDYEELDSHADSQSVEEALSETFTPAGECGAASVQVEESAKIENSEEIEESVEAGVEVEARAGNIPPPLPPRFMVRNNVGTACESDSEPAASTASACGEPSSSKQEDAQQQAQAIVHNETEAEAPTNVAEPMPEPISAGVEQPVVSPRIMSDAQCAPTYDTPVSVILEPESRVTIKRVGHTTLTLVVTAIAACLLGLMAGYMAYRYANFGLPGNVEVVEEGILIRHGSRNLDTATRAAVSGDAAMADSALTTAGDVSVAASSPSDTVASSGSIVPPAQPVVVTDTVRPGNYLSVMARRHYGNAKFWVYIYLENKDLIRDPDNLENGMVLVIPPASKYDIDASSKESLRKADREAYKAMSE